MWDIESIDTILTTFATRTDIYQKKIALISIGTVVRVVLSSFH